MSVLHPKPKAHPIHTVHRVGALLLGGFLLIFGGVGLVRSTEFMAGFGNTVFGLSTNGLLATVSVVVGLVLLGAAWRGGPTASSVLVVVGALFLLSGLVNLFTIGTAMNLLAFAPANVVFSLVVGVVLLVVGAYGRLTGRLPLDSPYSHREIAPPPHAVGGDGSTERALADAERAVAQHVATPEQVRRVRSAARHRTQADRLRAFDGED